MIQLAQFWSVFIIGTTLGLLVCNPMGKKDAQTLGTSIGLMKTTCVGSRGGFFCDKQNVFVFFDSLLHPSLVHVGLRSNVTDLIMEEMYSCVPI